MDNKISYRTLITRLEENALPYGILHLQNGIRAVITQRGGRIYPFPDEESTCLFWVNSAFAEPKAFKDFLDSGHWNLGGDRIWIAPEVQYSISDRNDFYGSFHLQEQMDPGHYQLEPAQNDGWRLHQDVKMDAHILAFGQKELHIDRLTQKVDDPLRFLDDYQTLIEGVKYGGYEQLITLEEKAHDDIVSEVWSLIQLNPGGTLYIPSLPRLEYTDYLAPVGKEFVNFHPNYVSLKITGDHNYKQGYKSSGVSGRMGYFNVLEEGVACLVIRNFFNNPSAHYSEEAAHIPGRRGHSIHVYNDDGGLGGFGEMECNGQTIGGASGRSVAQEQLVLWIYIGISGKVKEIALRLLGIQI
jgi:hypothetical protein